jgi:hypothetical protein
MRRIKNVPNYVARKELDDRSNRPVKVVRNSTDPPTFQGRSYGWQTKTGIEIRYPTAYSKKGWSSMRYRASNRKIIVGDEWLREKIHSDYPELIGQLIK